MLEATMVENHVHNHLQALGVSLVDESLIVGIAAKAGVNAVVVCRGIAVVSAYFEAVVG